MNVRLITIILIAVCVLFLAVGVDIVLSQQKRATSRMRIMEPPEEMRNRIGKRVEARLAPRRPFRPGSSLMEERYSAAIKEVYAERLEVINRRKNRARIRNFLKTQAGQYLDEGIRLLARGQKKEARLYIERALEQHQQFDFEIYGEIGRAHV